ncbi:MAG TPA: DUF1501 domain-containing protein [Tepidisphaeraceae bacterium]|nr:DUF1501 domain-containing protein [Tepidisphaeraceae bacterium]
MSNNDMMYSRRLFLTRGVQLLSVAGTVPLFLDRSGRVMAAEFAANPQGVGRPDRILVVLQLAGGNDGLNTVVPISNDDYYKARPKLGIKKKDALRVSDDFGFHPSAAGFKKLFEDGRMAVLHAVGYPNPNRSHFRGTDIWATAEPNKVGQTGWLGRYFDSCCSGADPGPGGANAKKDKPAEPNSAVALTNDPPTVLQGEKYLPIAFRNIEGLTYRDGARNPAVGRAFEKLNDVDDEAMQDEEHKMMKERQKKLIVPETGTQPREQTEEFLQRTALNARVYADQIRKTATNVQNKVVYPQSRLAADLKLVAQMIASGMPTRVYYVTLGGFDTHSNQENRHTQLMTQLSGAMSAFIEDLKGLGQLDRTVVMTFSEFGRRVGENGSQGTDHGEAAPLFMFGGPIRPGFFGQFPDLSPNKLHRGDVPFSMDFRRIYATVLKDWLKADDARILGNKFEPLPLFRMV